MDYRICVNESESWHLHKSDFALQNTQKKRFLQWIIAFVQMIVRVDTYTKLIFHCKTHKKMCFAMEYRICVISSQSWHLHKSDFPLQSTQKKRGLQ